MNNNIVGVNLNVDKDYLQEAVKQTVLMGISEALNGKNEIVSQIVNSVLSQKVDKTGKVSSYSSDNKYSLLEVFVNDMLTDLIKEEIKNMIESKKEEVSELIKKELNKKTNLNKFVDSFINSTAINMEKSWNTSINIDFMQKKDY